MGIMCMWIMAKCSNDFQFSDLDVYSQDKTVLDLTYRSETDDPMFSIPEVDFARIETTFSDKGEDSPHDYTLCTDWVPYADSASKFVFLCDRQHLVVAFFDMGSRKMSVVPAKGYSLDSEYTCGRMYIHSSFRYFIVACLTKELQNVIISVDLDTMQKIDEIRSGYVASPQRKIETLKLRATDNGGTAKIFLYDDVLGQVDFESFECSTEGRFEFVGTFNLNNRNLENCPQSDSLLLSSLFVNKPGRLTLRSFIVLQDEDSLLFYDIYQVKSLKTFRCSDYHQLTISKSSQSKPFIKYLPLESMSADAIIIAFPTYIKLVQIGSRGELEEELGSLSISRYNISEIIDCFSIHSNYYIISRTKDGQLRIVLHKRDYGSQQTEAGTYEAEYQSGFIMPSVTNTGLADLYLFKPKSVKLTRISNNNLILNFSDYKESTAMLPVSLMNSTGRSKTRVLTAFIFNDFQDMKNFSMPAFIHLFENTNNYILPSPWKGLMMSAGELKLRKNTINETINVTFKKPTIVPLDFEVDYLNKTYDTMDNIISINRNFRMAKSGRILFVIGCYEHEDKYNCVNVAELDLGYTEFSLLEGVFFNGRFYFVVRRYTKDDAQSILVVYSLDPVKENSESTSTDYYLNSSIFDLTIAYSGEKVVLAVISDVNGTTKKGIYLIAIKTYNDLTQISKTPILSKVLPEYICPRDISFRDTEFLLTLDIASKCRDTPHTIYHYSLSLTEDNFNSSSLKSSQEAPINEDFYICSFEDSMAIIYPKLSQVFTQSSKIVSNERDSKMMSFPFGLGNTKYIIDYQCIQNEKIVQILALSVKENKMLITIRAGALESSFERLTSIVVLPPHIESISTIINYHNEDPKKGINEFAIIGMPANGKFGDAVMIDVKDVWFQPVISAGKIKNSVRGELEFEYSFALNDTRITKVKIELNENPTNAIPVQKKKTKQAVQNLTKTIDIEDLIAVKGHFVKAELSKKSRAIELKDRLVEMKTLGSLPYKFNSLIVHNTILLGSTSSNLILMNDSRIILKESCKATNLRMIIGKKGNPIFFTTLESITEQFLTNLMVIFKDDETDEWLSKVIPLYCKDILNFRVTVWNKSSHEFMYVLQSHSIGLKQLKVEVISIKNKEIVKVSTLNNLIFYDDVLDYVCIRLYNSSMLMILSTADSRELTTLHLEKVDGIDTSSIHIHQQFYIPQSDYLGNITKIACSNLHRNPDSVSCLLVPEGSSVYYAMKFDLNLDTKKNEGKLINGSSVENLINSVDGFDPLHLIIHGKLAVIYLTNSKSKNETMLQRESNIIAVYDYLENEYALKIFCSNNLDPEAYSPDGSQKRKASRFVSDFNNDPPSRFIFDVDNKSSIIGFMVNDELTRLRTFATFELNNFTLNVLSVDRLKQALKENSIKIYDINFKPHEIALEKIFETEEVESFWETWKLVFIGVVIVVLLLFCAVSFWIVIKKRRNGDNPSSSYHRSMMEEGKEESSLAADYSNSHHRLAKERKTSDDFDSSQQPQDGKL